MRTNRNPSPTSIVRGADPALGSSSDVRQFEGRLGEPEATIKADPISGERTATAALSGEPGYFSSRTLQIVYVMGIRGMIELKSAEVTSLSSRFTVGAPNNVEEPTLNPPARLRS